MYNVSKKILSLIFALCLLLIGRAFANPAPLPASQAFQLQVTAKNHNTIIASWDIQPGYYLYRHAFRFKILAPKTTKLSAPQFPASNLKKNYPGMGEVKVYGGRLNILIPLTGKLGKKVELQIHSQGCADIGLCYQPETKTVTVELPEKALQTSSTKSVPISSTQNGKILSLLKNKSLIIILSVFFGIGFLLSLTPCVLPMIPILSGIIVGQKHVSHARAFCLSLAYVLGMAITYAIAGVVFGIIGSSANVQAFMQQPWIIIVFAAIFVAMALSLFDFYNIQLPQALQSRIAEASTHQKRGTYLGTFLMGCLSTLILSPCVTPALAGAIIYISDSGNSVMGGLALFSMGLGMGAPLLIIGAYSAKILPKAGAWMNSIKIVLGVFMLAVAIWMLARILPGMLTMILWAALAIGSAVVLGAFTSAKDVWQHCKKGLGIILFIYAIVLIIGAMSGQTNPLAPINFHQQSKKITDSFIPVNSINDINKEIAIAKQKGLPVLLDFYADWCIACKEMDDYTFNDKRVIPLLQRFVLLRANISKNSAADQAMQKQFGVIAPPTILFFDKSGSEIPDSRVIGETDAETFSQHLLTLLQNETSADK